MDLEILNPLLQAVVIALAGVISVAGAMGVSWIRKKAKLADLEIDDETRRYLERAAEAAIQYGLKKIGATHPSGSSQDAVVSQAADYLSDSVPDALEHFSMGAPQVKTYLDARVERVTKDNAR